MVVVVLTALVAACAAVAASSSGIGHRRRMRFALPGTSTSSTSTLFWEARADQCCTKRGQLANLVNLDLLAKLADLGGGQDSTQSW